MQDLTPGFFKEMRYLGGILGLAIAYLSKYFLDKRYVFRGSCA